MRSVLVLLLVTYVGLALSKPLALHKGDSSALISRLGVRGDTLLSLREDAAEFTVDRDVTITGDLKVDGTVSTSILKSRHGPVVVDDDMEVRGAVKAQVLSVTGDASIAGRLITDTLRAPSRLLKIEGNVDVKGTLFVPTIQSEGGVTHIQDNLEVTGETRARKVVISGGELNLNGDMAVTGVVNANYLKPQTGLVTVKSAIKVEKELQTRLIRAERVTVEGGLAVEGTLETMALRSETGIVDINGLQIVKHNKTTFFEDKHSRADQKYIEFQKLEMVVGDTSMINLKTTVVNLGVDKVELFAGHMLCPGKLDVAVRASEGSLAVFTIYTSSLVGGGHQFGSNGNVKSHDHGHFDVYGLGDNVVYSFKFSRTDCRLRLNANKVTKGDTTISVMHTAFNF